MQYDSGVLDAATREQVNALAAGALGALDQDNVAACRVLLLMLRDRLKG